MQNSKKQSIELLKTLLILSEKSRDFALSKLSYLQKGQSARMDDEYNQFVRMRDGALRRILEIQSCITWLTSLENEPVIAIINE